MDIECVKEFFRSYKPRGGESSTARENRIRKDFESGVLKVPIVTMELVRYNAEFAAELQQAVRKVKGETDTTKSDDEVQLENIKESASASESKPITLRRTRHIPRTTIQRGGAYIEISSEEVTETEDSDSDFQGSDSDSAVKQETQVTRRSRSHSESSARSIKRQKMDPDSDPGVEEIERPRTRKRTPRLKLEEGEAGDLDV